MRLAVAYLSVFFASLPVGSALAQASAPPLADPAAAPAGTAASAPDATNAAPAAPPAGAASSAADPATVPAAGAASEAPAIATPAAEADSASAAKDSAAGGPLEAANPGAEEAMDAPAAATAVAAAPRPKIEVGGYAKVGFLWQLSDDAAPDYIGHSNGFRMGAARVELAAEPIERSRLVLSIEGALDNPTDPLGVAGEKLVSVRDAYLSYELFPSLVVTAGQFKAPFLAETLISDGGLLLFDRSIVARGVRPPEGFDAGVGLSLDRQLGASLSSKRLAAGPFGVGYAVGVFNGNGANRLLNDNRSLTPVARLTVDWSEQIALGVAGHRNPRTTGLRPDLLEEVDTGVTADLSIHLGSVRLLTAYAVRYRSFEDLPGADEDRAQGVLAQVAWRHEQFGLEPAYRFALLDPSKLSGIEQVMHHTFALNWHPSNHPLRLFAAYTLRQEQAERTVANDGLDLGLQLNF